MKSCLYIIHSHFFHDIWISTFPKWSCRGHQETFPMTFHHVSTPTCYGSISAIYDRYHHDSPWTNNGLSFAKWPQKPRRFGALVAEKSSWCHPAIRSPQSSCWKFPVRVDSLWNFPRYLWKILIFRSTKSSFFCWSLSHGYPLVNIQKTMEHHHVSWENPL